MSRINQKMINAKLTYLSSELPKNYVLSHYKTGSDYHIEITDETNGHIHIISEYVGTLSETYHTIRVLYDVVHNINLGHDLRSE